MVDNLRLLSVIILSVGIMINAFSASDAKERNKNLEKRVLELEQLKEK